MLAHDDDRSSDRPLGDASLGGAIDAARTAVPPWPGRRGAAVDRRAGHGRHRGRRRRRQDGPAAGRAVRVPRLARHRRRRRPGGRRRRSMPAGRTSARSPGSRSCVAQAHAAGRLRATTDGAAAAREADVVVLIVPVMLDDEHQPDYRYMDAAVASIAAGVHAGLARHLRDDAAGRRHARPVRARARGGDPGSRADDDLFVAFSPERLFTRRGPPQPRDVPEARRRHRAGVDRPRGARSTHRVLDAEIVAMSSRRGRRVQQARRHDVPRRQHRPRQRVRRVRASASASTSRRSSAPRTASPTATSTSPASASAATASRSTRTSCCRGRPEHGAGRALAADRTTARSTSRSRPSHAELGGLARRPGPRPRADLPRGREGAGVLAGAAADRAAAATRARVSAYDPLLSDDEVDALRRDAVDVGRRRAAFRARSSPRPPTRCSATLDPAWFPELEVVFDGRNSLRATCPARTGVDVRRRRGRRGRDAATARRTAAGR